MSAIEWTDHTENVQIGCSRVSPGCEHCYAERGASMMATGYRGKAMAARYLPVVDGKGRWSREVVLDQAMLDRGPKHPKRKRGGKGWRSPRVFLGSMTDHFHEQVTPEMFLRVIDYMIERPDTIWQVVTKRPERAKALLKHAIHERGGASGQWPRIHLLATVEDQQRANERIPQLLACRPYVELVGLSVEPLLGPVSFGHAQLGSLGWVIVGGESGPGARPCSVEWIRSVVRQCTLFKVPCFVKQTGANTTGITGPQRHPKGGDWTEWPPDLRVRGFPR